MGTLIIERKNTFLHVVGESPEAKPRRSQSAPPDFTPRRNIDTEVKAPFLPASPERPTEDHAGSSQGSDQEAEAPVAAEPRASPGVGGGGEGKGTGPPRTTCMIRNIPPSVTRDALERPTEDHAGSSQGSDKEEEAPAAMEPRASPGGGGGGDGSGAGLPRTTFMIRNIPRSVTRDALVSALNGEGFFGCFDFVYLPVRFTSGTSFGYAFVNVASPEAAGQLLRRFGGFARWATAGGWTEENVRGADLTAAEIQGWQANVDRYRHSPLMHPGTPDQCRPAVYEAGVRVPFPAPTRNVRALRIRTRTLR